MSRPEDQIDDFAAIADAVIDHAKRQGASYADLRVVDERERRLAVRLGKVARVEQTSSVGFGVRVLVGGAWGYASAPDIDEQTALACCDQALAAARAGSSHRQHPVELAPLEPQRGAWVSPRQEDPFAMSLEAQFDELFAIDEVLQKAEGIRVTFSAMAFAQERMWLYTSDGSAIYQDALRSGGGCWVTAVGNGQVQMRSYPNSFEGQYAQGGYEVVRALDLLAHAEVTRDEAIELLSAPPCPGGDFDLVLAGNQLALQIHESVGHPNEFDRVLGFEADLAGRSFCTPEKRGNFVYGSEIVNLVADTTLPGGLATMGWDDDAVPAQRWHIVENGIHRDYFTNREFAQRAGGEQSTGANRAMGWRYPPQIRIPNLSLMPGQGSRDDLFADVEHGFWLDTVKTWSIDQMRLNFQFTCEAAREIKNGKLGRLYRNPTYQGITPQFWRSCDAIAGPEEWIPWGVWNCGKGQPMQIAEMTHGCAPTRFRNIRFVGA